MPKIYREKKFSTITRFHSSQKRCLKKKKAPTFSRSIANVVGKVGYLLNNINKKEEAYQTEIINSTKTLEQNDNVIRTAVK